MPGWTAPVALSAAIASLYAKKPTVHPWQVPMAAGKDFFQSINKRQILLHFDIAPFFGADQGDIGLADVDFYLIAV